MNTRIIFLDVETTGKEHSDGHRVIEIGGIDVVNRQQTEHTYHQYLNPERAIDPGAVAVHGIKDSMLRDKPIFSAVIESLLDYVRDCPIVAHNAAFDVGFLNSEIQIVNAELGSSYPLLTDVCSEVVDTLELARKKFPGRANSLDALCDRLGIDRTDRTVHGALLDCRLLIKVWLELTSGQKEFDLKPSEFEPILTKQNHTNNSSRVVYANELELARHNATMADIENNSK